MPPDRALATDSFRWLFESAPDAMLVSGRRGEIVLVNALVERLFGYGPDELIGQPVEVLIPRRFRGAHESQRGDYARNPHMRPMGSGLQLYGLHKDGREIPLEIALSPLRTAEGVLAVAAIRDISPRRQLERELEERRRHLEDLVRQRTDALSEANQQLQAEISARERSQREQEALLAQLAAANEELDGFAYVVSHDLKAPLRAINTITTWLIQDYAHALDEEGSAQMGLMENRVRRMAGLLEGILEYSRIGRTRGECRPVALDEIVQNVLRGLSPGDHVSLAIDDPLPTVPADPGRMQLLFRHLIGNAIHHNDKPRVEITIGCRALEGAWELSVADNGPGIQPHHFERVFQMFQTLSPRDRVEGSGIGLTLARRIVETGGGSMWLESTPGAGSTFRFTLRA